MPTTRHLPCDWGTLVRGEGRKARKCTLYGIFVSPVDCDNCEQRKSADTGFLTLDQHPVVRQHVDIPPTEAERGWWAELGIGGNDATTHSP